MPTACPVLLPLLTLALVLGAPGCAPDAGPGAGAATGEDAGAKVEAGRAGAVTPAPPALVVDLPEGGRLELPRVPRRIVAGNNSALDLLLALVEPGRVVGVPADAALYASGDVSGAVAFARYRGEDVLALQPDLVLTHWWQDMDTTNLLRNAGVPVLALPALRSFDDLETIVALVARAVDARDRGRELLAGLEQRRGRLEADGSRGHVGVMSYTNFGSGGWTAGAGTSLDLVIGLAGMRNVAAEAGRTGNDRIDIEELLLLDPDVIVVDGTPGDPGTSARYLRDEASLRHLSALRHDRLVFLPPNLQSTVSHRLLDAAEELARRIDALDPGSIGRDG